MKKKKGNKKKVALVLGGGGARGAYEAGVWQAMTELGMDIDIVTGTSVGSINGAMVCQGDLELTLRMWKELETHMIFDVPEGSQPLDYAKEIVLNKGAGSTRLRELLKQYVDEERIRNSSIDYGLVCVELKTLKPHFLFREDIKEGQLIDYILASSSAFPAIHAHEIDGVEYIDGGYGDVLPIEMAIKKGATKIVAVKLKAPGIEKYHFQKTKQADVTIIEPKWDLGNVLIFDVDNARKIMRLGYLDAMKEFGVYSGDYYSFAKDCFNKTDLKMADACAKIFDMDPGLIYTKESFIDKLEDIIDNSATDLKDAITKLKHLGSDTLSASLHNVHNTIKMVKSSLKDMDSLKDIVPSHILCILMAQNIKEKGKDSIFMKTAVAKIIPEVIHAAKFLVKYELV